MKTRKRKCIQQVFIAHFPVSNFILRERKKNGTRFHLLIKRIVIKSSCYINSVHCASLYIVQLWNVTNFLKEIFKNNKWKWILMLIFQMQEHLSDSYVLLLVGCCYFCCHKVFLIKFLAVFFKFPSWIILKAALYKYSTSHPTAFKVKTLPNGYCSIRLNGTTDLCYLLVEYKITLIRGKKHVYFFVFKTNSGLV